MRFILRRLTHSLFLLIAASILSFAIVDLAPGDYFDAMRLNPQISPESVAAIRAEYGLHRSMPREYASWLSSIFHGEWGFSLAYNVPARPLILKRAGHTLLLSGIATLLAWILAIPLGILAAAHPGKWVDSITRAASSALLAIPEIVLALLLLLAAVSTGYLPAGGLLSLTGEATFWARAVDLARHLALPVVCLAAGLLPLLLMHVRTAMIETLASPFIVAARAHGIVERRILWRHALPVAANPLLSLFGLSIGLLLSSSLLVETIFGWPGLGRLLVQAILDRDFFLVIDAVLVSAVFLIAGNLLTDLLLYWRDPRIQLDS